MPRADERRASLTAGARPLSAQDLRAVVEALRDRLSGGLGRTVRELGVEPVHQARVAARTLRSLLSTLRPLLEPTLFRRARRDLRNLALELEAIREADVRRDWLLALAAQSRSLSADPRLLLAQGLDAERAFAREGFREHADSVIWRERLERLEATLAEPGLVVASGDLRPLVRQRLLKRWKRLRRSGQAVRGRDEEAVHELRLAVKHARYASESLMPLLGTDPRPAVRVLKRLQGCLGDQRDALQALAWLRGLDEPLRETLLRELEPSIRRVITRRGRELGPLLRSLRRQRLP